MDVKATPSRKSVSAAHGSGELKKSYRKPNVPSENERPLLIEFSDWPHVKIAGVTLSDSSCWVENYIRCQDLVIEGIKVESNAYYNGE